MQIAEDGQVYPGYLALYASGRLAERVDEAYERLRECRLCPRECAVDRLAGKKGFCRSGALPVVASHTLHHGEEPPISGYRGSGTIFFSNCTLRCVYCQNFPISQLGVGNEVSPERLADMMLRIQRRGAHNVNLVTPTHFVPQVLAAVLNAVPRGLSIPIVYNTSGYEAPQALRLLDGVVDVYLPDAKYTTEEVAVRYSRARRYVDANRSALKEMYRQVGHLQLDEDGIARRGLIIRHLVLPGGLAGTREVLRFIAEEISPDTYISLMDQYFPTPRVASDPVLVRKVTWEEYDEALGALEEAGLGNGWIQEHVCDEPADGNVEGLLHESG